MNQRYADKLLDEIDVLKKVVADRDREIERLNNQIKIVRSVANDLDENINKLICLRSCTFQEKL